MQQLSRDGVALCYDEMGSGAPPLLFVHGMGCDHTDFAPQLAHFHRRHRVVAVDLRGYGQSDQPEQDYTIASFADDLAWLCDELGLYQPVVVGHSLGGMVAVDLAARYPDLPAAIVALDATIVPPLGTDVFLQPFTDAMRTPGYHEALRQFMALSFAPFDDPARKARILERVAATPQHVAASTWGNFFTWDSAAAAAACKAPILYIDHGAPNCDLPRFRQLCPQLLDGKTVGAGHWAMLEAPEQVNAMIARFLAIATPQSATMAPTGAAVGGAS